MTTVGTVPSGPTVRRVAAGDHAAWTRLFRAYRAFYELPDDGHAIATTWGWVVGEQHGMTGLVAVGADGALLGLANLRAFARPSTGTTGLYLDDLFVDPDARRSGAGSALLRAAGDLAAQRGDTVVRWITAQDNTRARALYDRHATATPWVTYDMAPGRVART
ncbi:GNAT family N-acetyltransferase [Cellulomonas sp. zg-ZUI222]|uniref:GNAT family N-acetyltransferase n=1 Tax=Cellulomonas TaxID=1707 RepID=UPI001A94FDD0|nr:MULTISPECIES: GNAT family N-acetyltransferase [Cellulomonas]MBO0901900.1 GNAT family N-acetyltransferase [Cellulomonas sp. zg-ZUI22]MBO0922140.1 GNAT family N-acetyltransferase [Cellulomonas wangleii]